MALFDLFKEKVNNIYVQELSARDINKYTLSISELQRKYRIGFNYAKNIMDHLHMQGYISEENEYKTRKLLVDPKIIWHYIEENFNSFKPIDYDTTYGFRENGHISSANSSTLNSYDNMTGHQFEYFCADLLTQNGFYNVKVTQESNDHGIDILAEKDDITYAIQCKCYSSNIGNSALQQAHTGKSLYHKDVAVVMTNRYFTQQAKEEAIALGVKLWDRDKLNELIDKSASN